MIYAGQSKRKGTVNMHFSEKLMKLRRKAGLSQEQLADRLGVTRQSVSKWESGTAMPELGKLIALADLFGVTLDELVREQPPEVPHRDTDHLERRLEDLARDCRGSFGPVFQYTSRRRLWGLPLVCVRFGHARQPNAYNTAVGIVAVGNFAVGVVSVGLICAGVISLGMISLGLLALGAVSVGYAAVGVSAVGVYAAGVSALGARAAVGISADTLLQ